MQVANMTLSPLEHITTEGASSSSTVHAALTQTRSRADLSTQQVQPKNTEALTAWLASQGHVSCDAPQETFGHNIALPGNTSHT
jgi:hypothetical protein